MGPEVVVDLSDPPSKAGRVTKPGLKVVPNTLSDHNHLVTVRVYHNPHIQFLLLTKKKRSNTARAIRRLLKLLLKLRLKKLVLIILDFVFPDFSEIFKYQRGWRGGFILRIYCKPRVPWSILKMKT